MSNEEYQELTLLEAIEAFASGEDVEWRTQVVGWSRMDGTASLVTYFNSPRFRIRKPQPKPKLEPRDLLSLWWWNGSVIKQIIGCSDELFFTVGQSTMLRDVKVSKFSKDPHLPLDQWLTIAQVAESLGKEVRCE